MLSLYRQAKDFEGKKQTSEASLIRIRSSIQEIQQEISSLLQSYRTKSQTELSTIVSEIAEVEYRLPALEDRVNRTQIKSPVEGVINRISFNTLGAFVKPGDAVLEIVPNRDDLIIEGKIDPKDIAYIQKEQKVRISLTAYDAARYGFIEGKVLKVSADAVEEQSGISYYIVETSIDSKLFEDDGSEVEVLPGMVASIDVLAGKRTILDYLWKLYGKSQRKSFYRLSKFDEILDFFLYIIITIFLLLIPIYAVSRILLPDWVVSSIAANLPPGSKLSIGSITSKSNLGFEYKNISYEDPSQSFVIKIIHC